jgi:IclR family transcriptional regulator, pca regulon regulatory protein
MTLQTTETPDGPIRGNALSDRPEGSDYVQSLDRGLSVIRAFSAERPRLTLSEVARSTGLTRAAARRFLLTLEHLGYVGSNEREFFLRPRVLDLGYAYLSTTPFWDLAQPHMETLVEELHESSSISVLDNDEIVYVARVPTKRIMTIALAVGSRLPAYPASMGRVLLAGLTDEERDAYLDRVSLEPLTSNTICDPDRLRAVLAEVREQGWAIVDQELEEGVRSIAAPIRDASGTTIAALNVSAHATRTTVEHLRDAFLPRLLATTERINTELGNRR